MHAIARAAYVDGSLHPAGPGFPAAALLQAILWHIGIFEIDSGTMCKKVLTRHTEVEFLSQMSLLVTSGKAKLALVFRERHRSQAMEITTLLFFSLGPPLAPGEPAEVRFDAFLEAMDQSGWRGVAVSMRCGRIRCIAPTQRRLEVLQKSLFSACTCLRSN